MGDRKTKIRSSVRREHAENYLLTSLVAFGVTIILISAILVFWLVLVVGYIVIIFVRDPVLDDQIITWCSVLIVIQAVIGVLLIVAAAAWLSGHEKRGLKFALAGLIFSLVALQSLYFFLSQFQAITFTLIQFFVVMLLLAYRRWYLRDGAADRSMGAAE